ncbi:MAG: hypothetical protein M5R40_14550 [Anaerolineae bacterium]|nr:hypothetical protein [Anaerolineae bacterium]
MQGVRLIERFGLTPGWADGWLRILPVGTFARFGRRVTVTPAMVREMAAHFGRIPETGIPVTRAHDDTAGKVGDLAALEARPDGLWGRIRWNVRGLRLLAEGAFRYLSPEVVWGPIDYDGRTVRNVLTGVSLVNQPFFGRQVSLFRLATTNNPDKGLEPLVDSRAWTARGGACAPDESQEVAMNESTNEAAERGLLDRLLARLVARLWPQGAEAEVQARLDELEAAQAERAQMERFGALEAYGLGRDWVERLARVAQFDAALADDLAARFRALLAQNAQAALFEEIGATGAEVAGPVERFNAAVRASMQTYGLDYAAAGRKVAAEQPALYREYQEAVTNRL